MRKFKFIIGEKYHVYNRGVDKRVIFNDKHDVERFFQTLRLFNTVEPIGSLYEFSLRKNKIKSIPLVYFITYSLQSNHFHFVLEQAAEDGISKFMKRVYVWYFNNKYKRSGSLFQGPYKQPSYLFEYSLSMGMVLAGADSEAIDFAKAYGKRLGDEEHAEESLEAIFEYNKDADSIWEELVEECIVYQA
jgi:hypothetical protein